MFRLGKKIAATVRDAENADRNVGHAVRSPQRCDGSRFCSQNACALEDSAQRTVDGIGGDD
jgi:hypothetical protein